METETKELQAGAELDAMVAERVMGWHRETHYGYKAPGYVWWRHWTSDRDRNGLVWPADWSPSTNPTADYEVLKHVRENRPELIGAMESFLERHWCAPEDRHYYDAGLERMAGSFIYYQPGDYSRAALAAVSGR